jgi:hypothetical protein
MNREVGDVMLFVVVLRWYRRAKDQKSVTKHHTLSRKSNIGITHAQSRVHDQGRADL